MVHIYAVMDAVQLLTIDNVFSKGIYHTTKSGVVYCGVQHDTLNKGSYVPTIDIKDHQFAFFRFTEVIGHCVFEPRIALAFLAKANILTDVLHCGFGYTGKPLVEQVVMLFH